MWFDSSADLGRILAVGATAYVTLVLVLRSSGKRTLAEPNAFDPVVTVALGSTLATIPASSDVSWSEGARAAAGCRRSPSTSSSRPPGSRSSPSRPASPPG